MKLVDRMLGIMGFEEEEEPMEGSAMDPDTQESARKRRNSLVSLPSSHKSMRVVVTEPASFEEVQEIADQLKARRPVILNLEGMDKDQAQRVLNFLSGSIYALDGTMKRVGTGIFLFAPPNVEVSMDEVVVEMPKEKNLFYGR